MNPSKVKREKVRLLIDLPNIGKEMEKDLQLLGIHRPNELIGHCPYAMHAKLSQLTGVKQDPCVIDVFISITRFMQGDEPKPWWKYTPERKTYLATLAED
jgi:hypothetical protein|tara:strand:- start:298 stop:597 length:300 start_codon:yes stop_codon:yes gene_type:complete